MLKITVTANSFCKSEKLIFELKKALLNYPHVLRLNEQIQNIQSEKELLLLLDNADIAIVGREIINKELLLKLPNLKLISKYGVGLDNIDLVTCKEKNILIGWTAGVNKRSVSEMSLAFMLDIFRNISLTNLKLKQDQWYKNGGFQLSNKTVGIIGLGNIGQDLVRLLQPFNCKILYYDIEDKLEFAKKYGVHFVSFKEIFTLSDVVSVHVPLTEKTFRFIDYKMFKIMRPGSVFINTSRGNVIVQDDLKKILQENHLLGAALDVYEVEPLTDKELISIPNLITTPHIGGNSEEAILSMGKSAIEHVKCFLEQQNRD